MFKSNNWEAQFTSCPLIVALLQNHPWNSSVMWWIFMQPGLPMNLEENEWLFQSVPNMKRIIVNRKNATRPKWVFKEESFIQRESWGGLGIRTRQQQFQLARWRFRREQWDYAKMQPGKKKRNSLEGKKCNQAKDCFDPPSLHEKIIVNVVGLPNI